MSNLSLPRIRCLGHCLDVLDGRSQRKIGYETTMFDEPEYGRICIRHHNTIIIEYHHGGSIVLRNGGYYSVTTKARLNRMTPFRIDGSNLDCDWEVTTSIDSAKFQNGMHIPYGGSLQEHKRMWFNDSH
jgi:hypothetical protein